jgi:serine/threonine protein kinase
MSAIPICQVCGNPLAPDGLCPVCSLMTIPTDQAGSGGTTATLKISPEAFASFEPVVRVRYFGDYELLEEIARGGMGVVWKARQTSLNRTVALKMILAGKLAGEAEVQRFRREAEAAANLQHPNIVAIHEVGEHEGQSYFSMDYIAGRDLSALVGESGPLPPARAAECLQTLAEAVHFAHQRGTLHRDLKPQNVLVDDAGVPRITDFGLAKFIEREDNLTISGAAMGSPSYMPPEQAAGNLDQVGPPSDIYALGAILYELLTGRPPFRAETPMATMRQVMESDAVAPRKLNPGVPPDLQTICLKCLEKNPARRYHSARALAEELGRFLKHEPIQAAPASALRKAESWLRRHPWTLVSAASLALMVLVGMLDWQHERMKFLENLLHNRPWPADQAHRPLDWRGQELKTWQDLNYAVFAMTALAWRRLRQSLYGKLNLKQLFGRPAEDAPSEPVSQRLRVVCGLISVAGLAFAALYFAKIIQVSVWEKPQSLFAWLIAYSTFTLSLLLLLRVVRDYQRFMHGLPGVFDAAAPGGQTDALRQAIFDGDFATATTLHRRTHPADSPDNARNFVAKLAEELRAKQPEKFAAPRKLWDLNWGSMGLVLVIETGAFAMLWIKWTPLLTPVAPAESLLAALEGFPLGAGIVMSFRVKALWQRLLIVVVCLLLAEWAASRHSAAGIVFGSLGLWFGACMMVNGFRRKRRK